MNRIQSFLRLATLSLILSAGLLACKTSKKAADVSKEEETEQEQVEEVEVETEPAEPTPEEIKKEKSIQLGSYFASIAKAVDNPTAAERTINEALEFFASPDVPVFIVIHQTPEGQKDYDEPTTILEYLNYLQDTGKNLNNIHSMKVNNAGKITELELIRK